MREQGKAVWKKAGTGHRRLNCWEFKACGREPGGALVRELGVCPAGLAFEFNGINRGHNGGRICWIVAGTFCDCDFSSCFATFSNPCHECDFFHVVQDEEGSLDFVITPPR